MKTEKSQLEVHHSKTSFFKTDKVFLTETKTVGFKGQPIIMLEGKKSKKPFYFDSQEEIEKGLLVYFFKSQDGFQLFLVNDN